MQHRRSVSVTARQQMYCASNFEQGDGEVPSPSILRKAKLRTIQLQGTVGEMLKSDPEMILA